MKKKMKLLGLLIRRTEKTLSSHSVTSEPKVLKTEPPNECAAKMNDYVLDHMWRMHNSETDAESVRKACEEIGTHAGELIANQPSNQTCNDSSQTPFTF